MFMGDNNEAGPSITASAAGGSWRSPLKYGNKADFYRLNAQHYKDRLRTLGPLPRLHDLPIPIDVKIDRYWTGQMIEMADHIGPYSTLRIIGAHGGRQLRVPKDPALSPFFDCVDVMAVQTLSWAYGGERIDIPKGGSALRVARRASVIAAVRAGLLTGGEAQRIIGTSRSYVAYLVNQTDEGVGSTPLQLPLRTTAATPVFPDPRDTLKRAARRAREVLSDAGVDDDVTTLAADAILSLSDEDDV